MDITVESYIDGTPEGPAILPDEVQQLHVSPALLGKMKSLFPNQIGDSVLEGLASLGGGRKQASFVTAFSDVLVVFFEKQEHGDVTDILDKLYTWAACKIGMYTYVNVYVIGHSPSGLFRTNVNK